MNIYVKVLATLCVLKACLLGCGCYTLKPYNKPYTFLYQDPKLLGQIEKVYDQNRIGKKPTLHLSITHPSGDVLRFAGGARVDVEKGGDTVMELEPGVYPFQLKHDVESPPYLSGALMAYNIDNTVALATIGKSKDTELFSPSLLKKAGEGMLARHTIQFDKRDVLTYWLGNRTILYPGGRPNVEVDFSATPGISFLTINGVKAADFRAVLPVYEYVVVDRNSGRLGTRELEHEVFFTSGEHSYRGYLRKLKDNDFTAFVRIPCAIPRELLKAAAEGTVSKFTVMSEGEKRVAVAEIVISEE